MPNTIACRLSDEENARLWAEEAHRRDQAWDAAIYTHGVLKPIGELDLREDQRVRVVVEPVDEQQREDRAAALARLKAGIAGMQFFSEGRLPSRSELNDRA